MITTTENDKKERLSYAYLSAVAARAGCQVSPPMIDKQSIDAIVHPISGPSIKFDVQLKATSGLALEEQYCVFDLPIKNYDDLRAVEVENARLLVVLGLPTRSDDWLQIDEEALLLRHCAYWHSLYGQPASPNTTQVRIRIPRSQILTPGALIELMARRHAKLVSGSGGL